MIPACEVVEDMICYEQQRTIEYKNFGVPTKRMKDRAHGLLKSDKIQSISGCRFEYNRENGISEVISTRHNLSCSCLLFFDKAICHHFIAACVLDGVTYLHYLIYVKLNFTM